MTNALLPGGSSVPPVVREELEALLDVRVHQPAAAIGRRLPVFAVTGPVKAEERVRTPTGGAWYVVDGFKDPTIRTFGGQPVPRTVRAELQVLAASRIALDRVFVVHQLPDNWPDEAPLPQLVPDQPRVVKLDRALIAGVQAVGRLARGAATVAMSVTAGLDPLVLGGVDHPTEPATIWVVLAQWDWPAE